MCKACGIGTDEIIAFGDDYADIGMLKLCGVGFAMGNAIDEVKAVADQIIGDNDNDGIGVYLKNVVLEESTADSIFSYKRATLEDIEELVRVRIIVLRAAKRLIL